MVENRVWIKGAGDLATGIALRLHRAGFLVVMTDIAVPTTVRRAVAFSPAVYERRVVVEDVEGLFCSDLSEIERAHEAGAVAVIADPEGRLLSPCQPEIVVDAIIAKRNLQTSIGDASIVIGVGPGFTAGKDCHGVVETKRGHDLGRVITKGSAIPNTGIPGEIGGYSLERLLRSEGEGVFRPAAEIGKMVKAGEIVGYVGDTPVRTKIDGILRGILQEGVSVTKGFKLGDVDPRARYSHCFSVSDKARAVGGGVLEAILYFRHQSRRSK